MVPEIKILIAGETGYIASELIPRLLELDFPSVYTGKGSAQLNGQNWQNNVEIIQGDITHPSKLTGAINGIHTAYYLIHKISSGRGYTFM